MEAWDSTCCVCRHSVIGYKVKAEIDTLPCRNSHYFVDKNITIWFKFLKYSQLKCYVKQPKSSFFSSSSAGVAGIHAGASHSDSATWPLGGTWVWLRTKAYTWLIETRPTSTQLPSAFDLQRWELSWTSNPFNLVESFFHLDSGTSRLFTFFCWQEKIDSGAKSSNDGMGTPEIKYGDSICYVQHVESGLWLTYQAIDAKSTYMGVAQRKVFLDYCYLWTIQIAKTGTVESGEHFWKDTGSDNCFVNRPFCTVRGIWMMGWRCLVLRRKNLTLPDSSAVLRPSLLVLSGTVWPHEIFIWSDSSIALNRE